MAADMRNQPMGLMRVFFTSADLTGANLTGANLARADLSFANLTNADFTGRSLSADVSGADLNGTILRAPAGAKRLKNLGHAKNVDRAIFD